jgi:hypothetical protein
LGCQQVLENSALTYVETYIALENSKKKIEILIELELLIEIEYPILSFFGANLEFL